MPDYDLWYIAGGQGEIQLGNQKFSVSRGDFFLWRPNELPVGSQDTKHPLRVFYCHFDCLGVPENWFDLPRPLKIRDTDYFESSARRCEELWRRDLEASKLETQRILLSLLNLVRDEAASPFITRDEAIEAIAARLKTDFQKSWTLDEMAEMTHLSRSQLVRRFRMRFDDSPLRFLNQIRLENARRMLLETDWSLDKIAVRCGFCDAAHFSNSFKKHTGFAAGTLRKR
jgi:AraC family transcriptional regulator of arabinose operon